MFGGGPKLSFEAFGPNEGEKEQLNKGCSEGEWQKPETKKRSQENQPLTQPRKEEINAEEDVEQEGCSEGELQKLEAKERSQENQPLTQPRKEEVNTEEEVEQEKSALLLLPLDNAVLVAPSSDPAHALIVSVGTSTNVGQKTANQPRVAIVSQLTESHGLPLQASTSLAVVPGQDLQKPANGVKASVYMNQFFQLYHDIPTSPLLSPAKQMYANETKQNESPALPVPAPVSSVSPVEVIANVPAQQVSASKVFDNTAVQPPQGRALKTTDPQNDAPINKSSKLSASPFKVLAKMAPKVRSTKQAALTEKVEIKTTVKQTPGKVLQETNTNASQVVAKRCVSDPIVTPVTDEFPTENLEDQWVAPKEIIAEKETSHNRASVPEQAKKVVTSKVVINNAQFILSSL
ncbi:unnamed protein product [Strongylus vulgaris]|uniref:Uncharacterized protein n=1 Tax=Strongylus vulgaris TaxID=40348 RepID=A0A3P7J301_STRVU|nr:unnamed protein product [Strongylus vulgaris]